MRWLLLFSLRYNDSPEKDKRKELPHRESWMHTRGYALLFCGLFFVSGLLNIFDVPVLTATDVSKTNYLLAIGLTGFILGIAFGVLFVLLHVALGLITLPPGSLYLIPNTSERLIDVVILLAMTASLFLLIRRLQRYRRVFKWAVYLNYGLPALVLVNAVCVLMTRDDTMIRDFVPSPVVCEYSISAPIRIRAVSDWHNPYSQSHGLTVYAISHDSGQTWQDFMLAATAGNSTCRDANTATVDSLNDRFFWLWHGQDFVFTRDGGKTWTLWRGENALSNHQDCLIQRITFSGAWVGYIDCHVTGSTNPVLRTSDGGFTWYQTGG